jgi:DNA processing protein
VLWLRGAGALPAPPASVAVVGARAATSYGETVAADLGSGLSDRGLTVVSGGAYGIDGTAHRAALAADAPTVAVMAGGADRFYPAGHDELLRRVVSTGLVVAEAPCGTTPSRWRFLQRNRLIACLTAATVVVEAGRRSGSLNTAGHAQVLGRPVGAVPGPVSSPSSAGCHALIRSGLATCVTGVDDVVELVGPIGAGGVAGPVPETADPRVVRVQDALSPRVERTTDEVAAASGLGTDTVRAVLAELEVDGVVAAGPAGWRRVGRRRG